MSEEFRHFYGIDGGTLIQLSSPRMESTGAHAANLTIENRLWFRGHYRLAPHDRVALFVGHDFRRKGLRYAIEAIARTKAPWKLLVVGLGKAREYVELADTLGIGDSGDARILFVGPTREMNCVYAASDALILPTFYDPFGLVALEALGHGLPVISTEFLGPGELVRAHDAGTIVASPKAVSAMAQALDALPPEGSAESSRLAARAREAGRGISPEKYMQTLLELYERVRKGRR